MANLRRSVRSRKQNTKYTNDIDDEEVKKILDPISGSSPSASNADLATVDSDSSESDFDAEKEAEGDVTNTKNDQDALSIDSAEDQPLSDGSNIETPAETDDEALSIATDYDSDGRPVKNRRIASTKGVDPKHRHFRGVGGGLSTHVGKEVGWNMLYGPAEEDLLPIVYVRDAWLGKDDITLPSRRSLSRVLADGPYGKVNRFGISEEKLRGEATKGWDWYYSDKGAIFRSRQQSQRLYDELGQQRYLPVQKAHSVILGPSNAQTKYVIEDKGCISLGVTPTPFNTTPSPSPDAMEPDQLVADAGSNLPSTTPKSTITSARQGWVLNVGSKVQCLAWAPNCNGSTQYLAIACPPTSDQRSPFKKSTLNQAAALSASPPYPSCIQIWSFSASQSLDQPARLNMTIKPRLRRVYCTNWGNVRQLIWCPVLHEKRTNTSLDEEPEESIGLLASTWSDGAVRVLDVSVSRGSASVADYLLLESAAYTAIPPPQSSIFTSVEWLSSADLALSTASGSIALFSITGSTLNTGATDDQSSKAEQPYYSFPVPPASTYILQMSSCYPSTFPGLLALTSAGGETSLVSLAQPHVENVSAGRMRLPAATLTFVPSLRGHITSQEDCLYFHSIRRFFSGLIVGRAAASGSITCHAVSRWHPFTLFGTSSGEVIASNTLRRVLPGGRKYGGGGHWQQRVVKYDWIPEVISDGANTPEKAKSDADRNSNYHIHDARPGVSRFHEGFRPERVEMSRSAAGRFTGKAKRKGATASQRPADIGMETIFEEENAVTTIAWNANLNCAGWIAIGFGSGTIRVEDVAWEE